MSRRLWNVCREGDCSTSLCSPVQRSVTSPKEALVHLCAQLPTLQFRAVPPPPVSRTAEKSPASPLCPPASIFTGLDRLPSQSSLLKAQQPRFAQPLSIRRRCSPFPILCPSAGPFPRAPRHFCCGEPRPGGSTADEAEWRGGSPPSTCWLRSLHCAPQRLRPFWPAGQLPAHGQPGPAGRSPHSCSPAAHPPTRLQLFLPGCETLHSLFLNLICFLITRVTQKIKYR